MANQERGEVPIAIGGRSYTLRLSINSICELEGELERRHLDSNYQTFFVKVRDGSIGAARLLLWACLRDKHPNVTVDDVGGFMEELGDLSAIFQALSQAMGVSQPDPSDLDKLKAKDAAPPPKAQVDGTGTRSRRRRVVPA